MVEKTAALQQGDILFTRVDKFRVLFAGLRLRPHSQ